jgi:hypothetical protein
MNSRTFMKELFKDLTVTSKGSMPCLLDSEASEEKVQWSSLTVCQVLLIIFGNVDSTKFLIDVVDKLLDSLNESYATVIFEIKERPDFEELHYAEIMTLLSIHEEKFGLANPLPRYSSEEGEILSDYGSSHESEEYEEEDVEN